MSGFRAYFDFKDTTCKTAKKAGDTIELSPDESRHLCGSLRAVAGDKVEIFDLQANIFACEILEANQKRAVVKIISKIDPPKQTSEVYIAQCMPKGKVFDDIIRQSVEIGASGVIALVSERSLVRFDDSADAEKKAQKWRTHVIEAVKQSANFSKFDIPAPVGFKQFISSAAEKFDILILASLMNNPRPILSVLKDEVTKNPTANTVCILIGPEGDMSAQEYQMAENCRFKSVTLGANVMKCDTAAICALSCTKAFFEA